MAVLVTGGAGYIGSHAVLAALEAGRRVVVLDDLSTGQRESVQSPVRFVLGSIRDAALVERIVREHDVTEVLHLAARTQTAESVRSPLAYYQANAAWTCSLIAACIRAGVTKFVLASTAAVYGEAAAGTPLTEASPAAPVTPYGASKAMAERMLQDAARANGLSYAILRFFNVAGMDPAGRIPAPLRATPHLILAACEAALGGRPLQVYGDDYPTPDGSGVRDYVHVSDVADAHLRALEALGDRSAMILNLGSGRGWSVLEVAAAVRRATGAALPILRQPRRPGDLAYAVADASRAGAEIGWRPVHGLDAMIAHTLAGARVTSPAHPSWRGGKYTAAATVGTAARA